MEKDKVDCSSAIGWTPRYEPYMNILLHVLNNEAFLCVYQTEGRKPETAWELKAIWEKMSHLDYEELDSHMDIFSPEEIRMIRKTVDESAALGELEDDDPGTYDRLLEIQKLFNSVDLEKLKK